MIVFGLFGWILSFTFLINLGPFLGIIVVFFILGFLLAILRTDKKVWVGTSVVLRSVCRCGASAVASATFGGFFWPVVSFRLY